MAVNCYHMADKPGILSPDIPLRPDPMVLLEEEKAELRSGKKPKRIPSDPKNTRYLLTGERATDWEAQQAAEAVGLGVEWVQKSKHLCFLAKYMRNFPSMDNMIGHAQMDIGTLDRMITSCEKAVGNEDIPQEEKLKYVQTAVHAIGKKADLMLMIQKAALLQEGVRRDLQQDERRQTYAPPSSGNILIQVGKGGSVEVTESEKPAA